MKYFFQDSYCRVLASNATNNLWVLNLILGLLEYSPGRITVSRRFTILQHKNFTFVESSVRRLPRSPLNWFLLTTDPSLFTVDRFLMHLLLAYSLPRNLTVKASVSVVTTYYIRVSDEVVVSVFISAETETNFNCRRYLAMDDRFDWNNQFLNGTPHYFSSRSWNDYSCHYYLH
jgi:hypothetical protein